MTDVTEGLRIALESAEADIAQLRAENDALLTRMVRAEKGEQSARACMATLLPEDTLRALATGKTIDDGEMGPATLLRDGNAALRARIAELNDSLDRAARENAALRARNAYLAPRERAGQLVANAVYSLDPEFYEAFRGHDVDPFNHDDRVVDYLRVWRESLAGSVSLDLALRDGLVASAEKELAIAHRRQLWAEDARDAEYARYVNLLRAARDASAAVRTALHQPCGERSTAAQSDLDESALDAIDALDALTGGA